MRTAPYDFVIVGAGIAGCALAHALSVASVERSKPLRICLLERSLAEPDRIVGELLQPGGIMALKKLGLEDCVDGIDAIPALGYCILLGGKTVHIPYPEGHQGRSFHHGRFIQNLRARAKAAACVDVVEATASELVECELTGRVLGVRATRKGAEEKEAFLGELTVIADGCFSNFRNKVMGKAAGAPISKGHFVGMILEDATLPIPKHGTVGLVRGSGPVLMYQIGTHDTRLLVDVQNPIPSDLKGHILTNIIPQLPATLQEPARAALDKDRLRRMPNTFLAPEEQGGPLSKEGVILLGDSWNMRHPLTGGGMTCAFNDVVLLRDMLLDLDDLSDWREVSKVLHRWHWARKPLASTVNILSVALYDLFSAEDPNLEVLRTGCFKYFELGGNCVAEPVTLLAAIEQSPVMLFRHFFTVALYSIWVLFTHPRQVASSPEGKPIYSRPRIDEYPLLAIRSFQVFWTACVVFMPLLWSEIHW